MLWTYTMHTEAFTGRTSEPGCFSSAQLNKCAGGQKFTFRSCADIPVRAAHWLMGAASHLGSNCSFLGNSRSVRCVGGLLGETTRWDVEMAVCETCVVFECKNKKENKLIAFCLTVFSSLAQQWPFAKCHWALQAMADHKCQQQNQLWHADSDWVQSNDRGTSWAFITLQASNTSDWHSG